MGALEKYKEAYLSVLEPLGIELLGDYTGNRNSTLHRCIICSHTWLMTPRNGKRPRTTKHCPNCRVHPLAKQHDEYITELFNNFGSEYECLEKYVSNGTKLVHKHNLCGHTWKITPKDKLRGRGCPKCYGNTKITEDEYHSRLKEVAPTLVALEPYINMQTKISHKHLTCGNTWEVRPSNVLYNHSSCPKCYGNLTLTPEDYVKRLLGTEYQALEDYIASNKPILHRHIVCGTEFKAAPNDVYRGNWGCPKCGKKFDKNAPSILYYIQIDQVFFKVGVTNSTVLKRFKCDINKVDLKVLLEVKFNTGAEALLVEKHLKNKYSEVLGMGLPGLLKSGNSEVANEDFLMEEDIKWLRNSGN